MIRLRRSRPEQQGYDEGHVEVLVLGYSYFNVPRGFTRPDGTADESAIRLAWSVLEPSIMANWDRPGRRPAAWWWFDSPQPRDRERFDMEAEQLHELGQLSKDEYKALEGLAREENYRLHQNWSQHLPFRRSWLFWVFLAPKTRKKGQQSELETLRDLDELTPLEREIRANPRLAMAGAISGCRSRFYYLTRRELELLGMGNHPKIETLETTRSDV